MRTFKTAWFTKAARKARIDDASLCKAVQDVANGQADDLGGGVFKKRLDENRYRSIVLAKGDRVWVFAYLFAKKDRANIRIDELKAFRRLAELYVRKSEAEIETELKAGMIEEICRDDEEPLPKRRLRGDP